MKKNIIICFILYFLFFIFSFINEFSNWLTNINPFIFFLSLIIIFIFGIINIITIGNNRIRDSLLLIFIILFLFSCDEIKRTFYLINITPLTSLRILFISFIFSIIINKRILSIPLFIISILNIFLNQYEGIFLIIYLLLIILLMIIDKKIDILSILCCLEILFMILNNYTSLFNNYTILFSISLSIIMFNNLYNEFKIMNQRNEKLQLNKLELNKLKEETLKSQIKPHFLFNLLTKVDILYEKESIKAEIILNKLLELMKLSLKNLKENNITFKEELFIIKSYLELINEIEEKPFILNTKLDYIDFNVPPLTLEPIIENTIKYSKINQKEDGYLLIEAKKENEIINIIISDNGCGFNINEIKNNSIGLKNIISRFNNINGNVSINSNENGTIVDIKIKEN